MKIKENSRCEEINYDGRFALQDLFLELLGCLHLEDVVHCTACVDCPSGDSPQGRYESGNGVHFGVGESNVRFDRQQLILTTKHHCLF